VDGTTDQPVTIYLDWDTASGATSYDVYWGTTTNPPKIATVTTSSYWNQTTPAAYYDVYYWRVVAHNAAGSTSSSTQDDYRTHEDTRFPPDKAKNVPAYTEIDWPDYPLATSYRLYVGESNPPTSYSTFTGTPPASIVLQKNRVMELEATTTYYWFYRAYTGKGILTYTSPVWNFTTGK
jgi:hypothetical protein